MLRTLFINAEWHIVRRYTSAAIRLRRGRRDPAAEAPHSSHRALCGPPSLPWTRIEGDSQVDIPLARTRVPVVTAPSFHALKQVIA